MTNNKPIWSSNLFDCCNTETLSACCCLPFTTIATTHELHKKPSLTASTCCVLAMPFAFYNFYPEIAIISYNIMLTTIISSIRNTVREQDGIISDQTCTDPFYDVFVTAICPHLSLAQTMRQQKFSKEQTYKIIVEYDAPKKEEITRE